MRGIIVALLLVIVIIIERNERWKNIIMNLILIGGIGGKYLLSQVLMIVKKLGIV